MNEFRALSALKMSFRLASSAVILVSVAYIGFHIFKKNVILYWTQLCGSPHISTLLDVLGIDEEQMKIRQ